MPRPIRDGGKFTNQSWRGEARRGRQETEQMTLDESRWGGCKGGGGGKEALGEGCVCVHAERCAGFVEKSSMAHVLAYVFTNRRFLLLQTL